jgi:hypothetical protein
MDEIKKIPPARRPQFFFADTPGKTSPKIGTSYDCQFLSWLDDQDKNATSLVLKISRSLPFTNPFSILLMGDATGKTTDGIDTLKVKDTTLLVANHHGSATDGSNSEKWISISNPKIVVFSASKSKHGHPDKEVMSRYLKSPSNLPWPIHEFSYSGDSFLNARPSLVTYHTEPEKQNKRSYFRALIRKALLNTMNEGTLRFNFADSSPSLMQPQKYLSMFPLIHITNFALVEAEITNDEYIQIAPKLHLLKLLTAVDFSKNKLRIKDSADNVMVAFTKALLEAASCITTLVFVENDIDNDYVKTTMNSETQFKKLIITDVK